MSTRWREAAGDKATAAGFECAFIKQNGRKAECEAYLNQDVWPERWPAVPIKTKSAPPLDEHTLSLFPDIPTTPPPGGATSKSVVTETTQATEHTEKQLAEIVVLVPAAPVKNPLQATPPEPVKAPLPVKPASQVIRPFGKNKDVLPSGRNKKPMPSFEKWFCQLFPSDIAYPAWRALTKAATDVLIICRTKASHAASKKQKDGAGLPWFHFTGSEAVSVFKMTRPTFVKAMHLLINMGFIKYSMCGDLPMRGGIVNGTGISARYNLSDEWKKWSAPKKDHPNIIKARLAKQNPSKGALTRVV